jgi:hypothetical protein
MLNRKLKTIGLLALAMMTMAVGAASSAEAKPIFEADSYPATIDGVTIEAASVFTFGSFYKWECKKAPFQGKLTVAANALTLSAAYEECRWRWPVTEPPPPFSIVEVKMNGCDYSLNSLEFLKKDEYLARADLACPAGKLVEIDLHENIPIICRLTVPAQTNKADVKLIDQTGKEGTADDDVEARITIEKLHYTQDAAGTCPVSAGTYEDLQYLGYSTLTATDGSGKQIGLRVSGE